MSMISIIIPCYNQAQYIRECLGSVLMQTFKDYEVIIVNDGSEDNSLELIQRYVDKYKNFKLINQENKGVIFSRNNAIRQASGQYIYPLDADDKISPNCLEKLFEAIINNKGDIITSRVMKFGEEKGELFLKSPSKYHLAINNCLINSALFRKPDFMKAGGYDENFLLGLEDYDLWLNMVLRHNLKIYKVPELLFFYRIKNETESRNKQQQKHHKAVLKAQLLKKYPQRKYYRFSRKIIRIFLSLF